MIIQLSLCGLKPSELNIASNNSEVFVATKQTFCRILVS